MIIGLTGSIGSGKGVVSGFLKERGFIYLSLSNKVREIARKRGIEINRKSLQDLGNKLREKEGVGVLSKYILKEINDKNYENVVVDGIRNPAEVEVLRNLKNFFLISVDAPQEIRFKRISKRCRESDPKTWDKFLEVDNRDKGIGESLTGQNVGKCMEMADFFLMNDSSLEKFQEKIIKLYEQNKSFIK